MAEKFDKYYEYFTRGGLREHMGVINIGPISIMRPGWRISIRLPFTRRRSSVVMVEGAVGGVGQVGPEEVQGGDVELVNPVGVRRVRGENVSIVNGELEVVEGRYVKLVNVKVGRVVADYAELVHCDVGELEYRGSYRVVGSRVGSVRRVGKST